MTGKQKCEEKKLQVPLTSKPGIELGYGNRKYTCRELPKKKNGGYN